MENLTWLLSGAKAIGLLGRGALRLVSGSLVGLFSSDFLKRQNEHNYNTYMDNDSPHLLACAGYDWRLGTGRRSGGRVNRRNGFCFVE